MSTESISNCKGSILTISVKEKRFWTGSTIQRILSSIILQCSDRTWTQRISRKSISQKLDGIRLPCTWKLAIHWIAGTKSLHCYKFSSMLRPNNLMNQSSSILLSISTKMNTKSTGKSGRTKKSLQNKLKIGTWSWKRWLKVEVSCLSRRSFLSWRKELAKEVHKRANRRRERASQSQFKLLRRKNDFI